MDIRVKPDPDFSHDVNKQLHGDLYKEVIDALMDGTLKINQEFQIDRKSHSVAMEFFTVKTFYLNGHFTKAVIFLEHSGGVS